MFETTTSCLGPTETTYVDPWDVHASLPSWKKKKHNKVLFFTLKSDGVGEQTAAGPQQSGGSMSQAKRRGWSAHITPGTGAE